MEEAIPERAKVDRAPLGKAAGHLLRKRLERACRLACAHVERLPPTRAESEALLQETFEAHTIERVSCKLHSAST